VQFCITKTQVLPTFSFFNPMMKSSILSKEKKVSILTSARPVSRILYSTITLAMMQFRSVVHPISFMYCQSVSRWSNTMNYKLSLDEKH